MMQALILQFLLDSCLDGMFNRISYELMSPNLGMRENRQFSRITFLSGSELRDHDIEDYLRSPIKTGVIMLVSPIDKYGGDMIDIMYAGGFASFWLDDIVDIVWV